MFVQAIALIISCVLFPILLIGSRILTLMFSRFILKYKEWEITDSEPLFIYQDIYLGNRFEWQERTYKQNNIVDIKKSIERYNHRKTFICIISILAYILVSIITTTLMCILEELDIMGIVKILLDALGIILLMLNGIHMVHIQRYDSESI